MRRSSADGKTKKTLTRAVYDGRDTLSLKGTVGGLWRPGRASTGNWWNAFFGTGVEPRDFLTHYDYRPFVSKAPTRIVGTVDWNGRSVLHVETDPSPRGKDGSSGKVRFLFDPKRGFALVKRSILFQRGRDEDWQEYTMVEMADFKEITSGLWVPTRAKHECRAMGTDNKLMSRQELRFTEWDLKPDLSESVFHLEFPAELRVIDERKSEGTEGSL
jgi:hypothetical protein